MIINRYIGLQISRPFVVALSVLIVLFASFNVAAFLSDAANGLLPTASIAELVSLKVLISLEVLIPLALYVAVFLGLTRLYGDAEITAMLALRMTPVRVAEAVLAMSVGCAVVVAGLSLTVRPWAYARLHALSVQDEMMVDVSSMEAGTFYQAQHGRRVIYLGDRVPGDSAARDVFVLRRLADHMEVTHGRTAHLLPQQGAAGALVDLDDARIYELGDTSGQNDQILAAGRISVATQSTAAALAPDHSPVASASLSLLHSTDPQDEAELQWRLSTPISTLLLGLLGLLMSRPQRQQGNAMKITIMIVLYFAYDLLFTSARTWVQHGTIAVIPGIWWVPALLGLFLVAALFTSNRTADWRRA